jgi:hypothetical protein
MKKIDVNGRIMWESCDGERYLNPEEKPKDLYGFNKITVDGKVMWESSEGERVFGG